MSSVTIDITAPAKRILPEEVDACKQLFNAWKIPYEFSKHFFSHNHRFSGTDHQRLEDLQRALDNPHSSIIFAGRGGYGSIRILQELDWGHFTKAEKLFVGFSDITYFHLFINFALGLPSVHGQMPAVMEADPDLPANQSLYLAISERQCAYQLPTHTFNTVGQSEGLLIGGNLSILYSALSFPYVSLENCILFIEEIGEELYHIDRIFQTLLHNGTLEKLKGLVIGQFTNVVDTNSWFDLEVYELIHQYTENLNIPVCFNFPAGHVADNRALILGKTYTLEVTNEGTRLTMV